MAFRNLTPEHVRAARALLDWTQGQLAAEAGLALSTIKRLEKAGMSKASVENIDKLSSALEAAGVEFIDAGDASPAGGPGVRLRKGQPE